MSVAPVLDQRKVEDCPASTVEGSAVKLPITGAAAGVGGAMGVAAGGGGGGGGGTFFAQPTANNTSADSSTNRPILDACNLKLSLILTISSSRFFDLLLCCFTPNRLFVVPLHRELLNIVPICGHGVNLRSPSASRSKHQVNAIGSPIRILIS